MIRLTKTLKNICEDQLFTNRNMQAVTHNLRGTDSGDSGSAGDFF